MTSLKESVRQLIQSSVNKNLFGDYLEWADGYIKDYEKYLNIIDIFNPYEIEVILKFLKGEVA